MNYILYVDGTGCVMIWYLQLSTIRWLSIQPKVSHIKGTLHEYEVEHMSYITNPTVYENHK